MLLKPQVLLIFLTGGSTLLIIFGTGRRKKHLSTKAKIYLKITRTYYRFTCLAEVASRLTMESIKCCSYTGLGHQTYLQFFIANILTRFILKCSY